MAEIRAIKTLKHEIDENILKRFEQIREHVESGNVAGLAVAMTFRDGNSLTFSSGCDSRREMLGLMLDSIFDYQKGSS